MAFTEEELKNLPKVLTEEQERQIEEERRIYTLERTMREFEEGCKIIEEMVDKYKGILPDEEIHRLIKEEIKRRGL